MYEVYRALVLRQWKVDNMELSRIVNQLGWYRSTPVKHGIIDLFKDTKNIENIILYSYVQEFLTLLFGGGINHITTIWLTSG